MLYLTEKENYDLSVINFQSESGFCFFSALHGQMPYMKFLYVRSDVCRQLLSDSTSQWTPLLLAIQFPLLGLVWDLHPLE